MEKYIWEESKYEIKKVIDLALDKYEKIISWQTIDTNKQIEEVYILNFDALTNQIILSRPTTQKKIDEKEHFYLRFSTRSMILKTKILRASKEYIEVKVPDKVKLVENRCSERVNIAGNETIYLEKINTDSLGKSRFSFQVLNYSDKGLGLSVTEKNRILLEIGDKFKVLKKGGVEVSGVEIYKIVHMSPLEEVINTNRLINFRVGLAKEEG